MCGLLDSSGVAGHPKSYFNRRGLHDYATRWRVSRPDERIDSAYVQAALDAGRTPNGVFGGRLMAESRLELLADLAAEASQPPVPDLELLSASFGRLRFVHLQRLDVVAQAVSWAKAQQTHYWHPGERVEPGAEATHYDEALIETLVMAIERFEADWNAWFAQQHIRPFEVTYEQLAADPGACAHQVLNFLDLELPAGHQLVVGHRRQADQVNAEWIARYRAR